MTPVSNWQQVIAKVRRVVEGKRGSSRGAAHSHLRYLQHKDCHEHKDRLVTTIGDMGISRSWSSVEQHYRVIVAPERGDVLDMVKLCDDVTKEIRRVYGDFEFAGAVHEKLQINGKLNKHLHLIFKDTFDVGARALIKQFATVAERVATLQFEDKGLHYLPNVLDRTLQRDARELTHELTKGDHSHVRTI